MLLEGMIYHTINAFEQDNKVILDADVGEYDSDIKLTAQSSAQEAEAAKSEQPRVGGLYRFTMDVATLQGSHTLLSSDAQGFSVCSPSVLQKPYSYAYGVDFKYSSSEDSSVTMEHLYKVNVQDCSSMLWNAAGIEYSISEPQFVSNPDAVSEDDGVVLVPANDVKSQTSWLLVVDARSLEVCARISAPIEVNVGLHNWFVPSSWPHQLKN